MKQNWIYFVGGIIVGVIVATIIAMAIVNGGGSSLPSGVKLFDKPQGFVPEKAVKVEYVVDDNAALVVAEKLDHDDWFYGPTYLLVNRNGTRYYSDEEIIRLARPQGFRKIGIYKIKVMGIPIKTVAVVEVDNRY